MVKRIDYQVYPYFALRSPLLPLEELSKLSQDPDQLTRQIKDWWSDPMIRDAIYLASPDFFRELDRHIIRETVKHESLGLYRGFIRYLARMSSRCTPFGLFASFGVGHLGENLQLFHPAKKYHQIHLRLDMEYLAAFSRMAAKDPDRIENLHYRPNNTLYRIGNQWRYVEVQIMRGGRKVYELVHLEHQELLTDLFEFTQTGKNLVELVEFVVAKGWEREMVREYLLDMIESQVLVSELEPVVSGINFMDHLERILAQLPDHDKLALGLHTVRERLADMTIPGTLVSKVGSTLKILDQMEVPYRESRVIQGDMILTNSGLQLDKHLADRILFGVRIRRALMNGGVRDPMKGFKESFEQRFGEARVPLLLALDPETGIGLDGSETHYLTDPVPWIDDLRIPGATHSNPVSQAMIPDVNRVFWPTDESEFFSDISRQELKQLPLHEGVWPDQLQVILELTRSDTGETVIHFRHCSGGNPAFLLARFAQSLTSEAGVWIKKMLKDEESGLGDGILAEIVHLPEDRTGNVLQRPDFCAYEIPYLAQSLKPDPFQIPVTDLMVSIVDGKVNLYSKRLNKRIYPKLTNAHNYMQGKLNVYKFLCLLQEQNMTESYNADPGPDWPGECFVSGIRFENLILRDPVWRVDVSKIEGCFDKDGEPNIKQLNAWRNRLGIPEKTLWMEGDQELYICWTHRYWVAAAWESIRKYRRIRLRPWPYPHGSRLTGEEDQPTLHYANQIVLSYKRSDLS